MTLMNDPYEFTPKEQYQISLFKDPAALFIKSLNRTMIFVVPSVVLVAYSFIGRDPMYAVFGYALLLFYTLARMNAAKKGLQTMCNIVTKYEGKLQNKN